MSEAGLEESPTTVGGIQELRSTDGVGWSERSPQPPFGGARRRGLSLASVAGKVRSFEAQCSYVSEALNEQNYDENRH